MVLDALSPGASSKSKVCCFSVFINNSQTEYFNFPYIVLLKIKLTANECFARRIRRSRVPIQTWSDVFAPINKNSSMLQLLNQIAPSIVREQFIGRLVVYVLFCVQVGKTISFHLAAVFLLVCILT